MSLRSSAVRSVCPTTMSRSSSVVTSSRSAFGLPPSSLTTPSVDFDNIQMIGRDSEAIRSRKGATYRDRPSARCRASRLGASSPRTSDAYEMASVTSTSARTGATASGTRQPVSTGTSCAASRSAPNAADSMVATVTPICTADRNRLGSRASLATRSPLRPRCESLRT